jgi:hypothetical protein
MSYTKPPDLRSYDWALTANPPNGCSDRLYHFDPGGQYGFYDTLDDSKWYRLNCSYWFGDWIEANGGEGRWTAYGSPHRAIYFVREDLYAFIKLKWL